MPRCGFVGIKSSLTEESGSFSEQDSTTVPKSAYLRFCPFGKSCWGVPSPNPAMRLAPLENPLNSFSDFSKQFRFTPCFSPISERTPRTERSDTHSQEIQHAPPQPCSQDPHDRGRIRRLHRAAGALRHQPSRVYPASHNTGYHSPRCYHFPGQ